MFAVFRVVAGLFLGVCTPIVTTLFTEFTPTKQRSFFITFGMAWMIVGWVVAALVGTIVDSGYYLAYVLRNWRSAVLYAFIFGKFTPESAHWCSVKGNAAGADKTLERIQKRAGKPIPYEIKAENIIVPPVSAKASPAEVWKGKYLKTTVALVIIYFAGNFSIYGVNAWLPSLPCSRQRAARLPHRICWLWPRMLRLLLLTAQRDMSLKLLGVAAILHLAICSQRACASLRLRLFSFLLRQASGHTSSRSSSWALL